MVRYAVDQTAGRRGMNVRIGYQGEPGAYSEAAVVTFFGGGVEPVPCPTFADVFEHLADGEIDGAMLPVENSYAGDVSEVYDLLHRFDVRVFGELELAIRHCLLAIPGTTSEQLRIVRSHPQALSQCRRFLRGHSLFAEPVHDTAAAARQVAEAGRKDLAAIASRRAAECYGLSILAEDIQDTDENSTRFYAVATPGRVPTGQRKPDGWFAGPRKTCLLFAVEDRPGALYHGLGVFAGREINLTKLTSRPYAGRPWEYMFFADLEGDVADPNVAAALEELKVYCSVVRVLGSFPSYSLKNPNTGKVTGRKIRG